MTIWFAASYRHASFVAGYSMIQHMELILEHVHTFRVLSYEWITSLQNTICKSYRASVGLLDAKFLTIAIIICISHWALLFS